MEVSVDCYISTSLLSMPFLIVKVNDPIYCLVTSLAMVELAPMY